MEQKEMLNLKTYFQESLFMDGLFTPEGNNIAPKTENSLDLETGYKYHSSKYGVDLFEIKKVVNTLSGLKLQGIFVVSEIKDYDYYWNNETKKTIFTTVMPFMMLDNGTFESEIKIKDNIISVETIIDDKRFVDGVNFDNKSVRDGLFSEFGYCEGRKVFKIEEHYQLLKNNKRLLHYSNSSLFFEIYDLPNDWTIKDGLTNLANPKVFNDVNYDLLDEDIKEILEILKRNKDAKQLKLKCS